MKTNKIYLILAGLILSVMIISCGVNRTAGCDAYGQMVLEEQNQDLATK